MTTVQHTVGEAVVSLRRHLGMTQERFAEKLGVSFASVARFELYADPGARSLVRLADLARSVRLLEVAAVFDDAIARKYGAVAQGRVADLLRVGQSATT